MKYNLPTLLALCQDTGVHCKWTSEAKYCRRARLDRSKKPILSENPRNRPTKESARLFRPNKTLASKAPKNRPTRTSKKSFEPVFPTNDAGFAQFLKKHTSPKHQRVTAGGRIVPMEPSRPSPRFGGSSPMSMTSMNDDEFVVFVDGQPGTQNQATQESFTIIHSSTASDINLHEGLPSPFLESTSQFAAPVGSRDLTVSQLMESDNPYAEWIERVDEIEFVRRNPSTVRHEPARLAEERQTRWGLIMSLINLDDAAIVRMMLNMCPPFAVLPDCDFYVGFVRVAYAFGLDTMIEAKSRLMEKVQNHERFLEEVNEVIALNPQIPPSDDCYNLRVYNISERARVLSALDQWDMLMGYPGAASVNNSNGPEGITVQTGGAINGGSYDNQSTDGTNEVERANINRGVDIIDPNTGHPIQIQRKHLTAADKNCNGTSHTNGNNSDLGNVQVDGSSDLWIHDDVNEDRNRNRSDSFFNQIQVDRRSELFHDANGTGGNVPTKYNDPSFDANSRVEIQLSPEMGSEMEHNGIISWIPQETWTERRPGNRSRISNTLPRNFGRNVSNFRSALHSITEIDHEEHVAELTNMAGNDRSHSPSLATTINEDATLIGLQHLHNEARGASISGGSDDEQQTRRHSSLGQGLNEDNLSEVSFDRPHRSTELFDHQSSLIPTEFFDMFVVDVEGPGERRGPFAEQSEHGMNHSRSGSFTRTMNSFGGDYPDDMSDAPLLSRNSTFGRDSLLSQCRPSRAISRSSVRRKHYVPAGGLSSVGSRMISSSLDARRRHDARENVQNAGQSLMNPSRLIGDLRDEVPTALVLGFETPDSQQNTNYLSGYSSQLINASVRHTAPAIVNTSRINVHAQN
ncbi:hypothetical protein CBS147332_1539 [Penicillium roqueforti]|nr:hypothetical protein CBS147332_1539 [Penicillium roqueforti]KAI3123100.1 hypothetical protein CBS147331_1550 [Penicillium roqueforti]